MPTPHKQSLPQDRSSATRPVNDRQTLGKFSNLSVADFSARPKLHPLGFHKQTTLLLRFGKSGLHLPVGSTADQSCAWARSTSNEPCRPCAKRANRSQAAANEATAATELPAHRRKPPSATRSLEEKHSLLSATVKNNLSSRQLPHTFAKYFGVMINVIFVRKRRHQRHVVKRRYQDAAIHAVKMHKAL